MGYEPLFEELQPLTIVTDGSAGSSTGNATTGDGVHGGVYGLHVDYGSAPATTVLTGYAVGADGSDLQLFVIAAGNTDGYKYPRGASLKASDGAVTGLNDVVIPLAGRKLKIAVSGANDANTVIVRPIIVR
ncbi:MAG: hypothetical protein CL610_06080 [Anaerolineaceae bacterium]|nr:hypothetical protein [Anaerolineaceae bacterium]